MSDDALDIVRRASRGALLQAVFGIAAALLVLGGTVVAYLEIRDLRGQLEALERAGGAPDAPTEWVIEPVPTGVENGRRERPGSEVEVEEVIEPVPGPDDTDAQETIPSEATAEEVDRADPPSR